MYLFSVVKWGVKHFFWINMEELYIHSLKGIAFRASISFQLFSLICFYPAHIYFNSMWLRNTVLISRLMVWVGITRNSKECKELYVSKKSDIFAIGEHMICKTFRVDQYARASNSFIWGHHFLWSLKFWMGPTHLFLSRTYIFWWHVSDIYLDGILLGEYNTLKRWSPLLFPFSLKSFRSLRSSSVKKIRRCLSWVEACFYTQQSDC